MLKSRARMMANTAPYCLATGTLSLLATGTINRMAAPVTFTPATAVPLVGTANGIDNNSCPR